MTKLAASLSDDRPTLENGRTSPKLHHASSVISRKVRPPEIPRDLVGRDRLVDWLLRKADQRVIIVAAQAGYGKTTLLADFARRTRATCVWYHMEHTDTDWRTFLAYLISAFREQFPDFGESTLHIVEHGGATASSRERATTSLLAELDRLQTLEAVLLVDDVQHTHGSADVSYVLGRLLDWAPRGVRFILAGRVGPELRLGRLESRGDVSVLPSRDLRFDRKEVDEYLRLRGLHASEDSVDRIAEKCEGWIASLEAIARSIGRTKTVEIEDLDTALARADDSFSRYISEEVLTWLSPEDLSVLRHAALAEAVRPHLVAASMSTASPAQDPDTVTPSLRRLEEFGLLNPAAGDESTWRLHPALRRLLARELVEGSSASSITKMHSAIAAACTEAEWLLAAHHHLAAGQPDAAMGALARSATQAIGQGAWGAVAKLAAQAPSSGRPAPVEIVRARAMAADGDAQEALYILERLDRDALSPNELALLNLARTSALRALGDTDSGNRAMQSIADDATAPRLLRQVAQAAQTLDTVEGTRNLEVSARRFRGLADELRASGLHYFSGIALINGAALEIERANYTLAKHLAGEAAIDLEQIGHSPSLTDSLKLVSIIAQAEEGDWAVAAESAIELAREPDAGADVMAEAAFIASLVGRDAEARMILNCYERGEAAWAKDGFTLASEYYARAAIARIGGDLNALSIAEANARSPRVSSAEGPSRNAILAAARATLERRGDAATLAEEAVHTVASQQAWRWSSRAELVRAAATRNRDTMRLWVDECAMRSALALLECADVVSANLDLIEPLPSGLESIVVRAPNHWRPLLRRQLLETRAPGARAAAQLLARVGSIEDVTDLKRWEESTAGRSRRRGYASKLIRRVSPTARVHDLGPTSYQVGNRTMQISEQRRRPASLLLFLVTHPNLSATREQAMEGLWPSQNPTSALNSLHQTLFFLRRDIEPWYEDGHTADYVRMESDLVFLDPEMFQVDSVAFVRQASRALGGNDLTSTGPSLIGLYPGGFAPEFEYEDWAAQWRSHVHGTFLHLAQRTASELLLEGDSAMACSVLTSAVAIDPLALDLRGTLVSALLQVGSSDAARWHYQRFASLYRSELGQAPPTFESLRSSASGGL